MTFKKVITLQFKYYDFLFEENFKKLSSFIKNSEEESLIVAPELSLSNFCYKDMKKATDFSKYITNKLTKLTNNKTVCLTMLEEENGKFYNRAKFIHHEKIIFQRDKYELFKLGNEDKYFTKGKEEDIKIFECEGIKYAILICFELRFINLWEKIKGADIVIIPALWGKSRKKHLEIIANSLSIINQCYVIVSNSANDDMGKNSLISSPFGKLTKDNRKQSIKSIINLKEIEKMRKYLNIGMK